MAASTIPAQSGPALSRPQSRTENSTPTAIIQAQSAGVDPNPRTPWTMTDEAGHACKMHGHNGRPGTTNYRVTRRTHPTLQPGDEVTVYPNEPPQGNDTIAVYRPGLGFAIIQNDDSTEEDVLLGVAWERRSSNLSTLAPWDGIIDSTAGPAAESCTDKAQKLSGEHRPHLHLKVELQQDPAVAAGEQSFTVACACACSFTVYGSNSRARAEAMLRDHILQSEQLTRHWNLSAAPASARPVFLGLGALRPAIYQRGDSENATTAIISMLDAGGAMLDLETALGEGEQNALIAVTCALSFSQFAQAARNRFREKDAEDRTTKLILPVTAYADGCEDFDEHCESDFSLRLYGASLFRIGYLAGCMAGGGSR